MMKHLVGSRTWRRLLPLTVAPFIASCGDGTAPPAVGQLLLVTTTGGEDVDPDGYTYSVDGGPAQPIASNASVPVAQVLAGTRTIAFAGVAGNCQAATTVPVVVTLAANESREIRFDVTCEPRLRVFATTTGEDLDVAFLVAIDAGALRLARPNTRLDLSGVPPGSHELRIAGVAPNCILTGPGQRQITVPADAITTIQLEVACSATTRRILFGSTRDGGWDLYVMNADGTNTVRVSDGSRHALHGRWSPGADRIVYHSSAAMTGPDITGFDIHVMNADGSGSTALTSDGSTNARNVFPDWSPDGTKILWEKGRQIWVMDANGANARQLRAFGSLPRWSPDGTRIAFHGENGLSVMDADGSNVRVLQAGASVDFFASPAWSPDGTKILFASSRDGSPTAYVMSADGSGVSRLTGAGDVYEHFDWSPDGTKIAFRTNRDGGNPEIYVMNADGSSPTRIAPNPGSEFGPAWRP